MRKATLILLGFFMFILLTLPPALSVAANSSNGELFQLTNEDVFDAIEENRTVNSVESAYWNLAHQGEWLGFYIGPVTPQIELFPGPFKHHVQGMARSPRTDIAPVFYVSVSGDPFDADSFPALMVVQLPSLETDGERLGSNRLKREPSSGDGSGETVGTDPPAGDQIVKMIKYSEHKHPSGIAMVGDILAVPMGNKRSATDEELKEIKIIFYDCSDPLNPFEMTDRELIIKPEGDAGTGWSHGSQAVAIAKLPADEFSANGRFFRSIRLRHTFRRAALLRRFSLG